MLETSSEKEITYRRVDSPREYHDFLVNCSGVLQNSGIKFSHDEVRRVLEHTKPWFETYSMSDPKDINKLNDCTERLGQLLNKAEDGLDREARDYFLQIVRELAGLVEKILPSQLETAPKTTTALPQKTRPAAPAATAESEERETAAHLPQPHLPTEELFTTYEALDKKFLDYVNYFWTHYQMSIQIFDTHYPETDQENRFTVAREQDVIKDLAVLQNEMAAYPKNIFSNNRLITNIGFYEAKSNDQAVFTGIINNNQLYIKADYGKPETVLHYTIFYNLARSAEINKDGNGPEGIPLTLLAHPLNNDQELARLEAELDSNFPGQEETNLLRLKSIIASRVISGFSERDLRTILYNPSQDRKRLSWNIIDCKKMFFELSEGEINNDFWNKVTQKKTKK